MYDYVAFYDGKSENNSLLGVFCGNRLPPTMMASSNYLFMILKSDKSLQRKGFSASYNTSRSSYVYSISTF